MFKGLKLAWNFPSSSTRRFVVFSDLTKAYSVHARFSQKSVTLWRLYDKTEVISRVSLSNCQPHSNKLDNDTRKWI